MLRGGGCPPAPVCFSADERRPRSGLRLSPRVSCASRGDPQGARTGAGESRQQPRGPSVGRATRTAAGAREKGPVRVTESLSRANLRPAAPAGGGSQEPSTESAVG